MGSKEGGLDKRVALLHDDNFSPKITIQYKGWLNFMFTCPYELLWLCKALAV